MSKKSFSKPALSLQDQLALLDSRGLNIEDQDEALELLQHNNYYRLEGYWYPFYDANLPNHQFKEGVSIKQVANFYKFDIKLRELVFRAISTIEVSFRSKFAYQLAMDFGPFPFDNKNCFHFSNTQNEQDTKKKIEDEARKSKEEFIQHFYANYSDDLPTIWMLVEILTFGEISTFYEYYLNNKSRKQIAKSYGVTDSSVMSSWIRQLCIVRNVCAHHLLKSLPSYSDGDSLIFSLNGIKPIDFQFVSLRLHRILEANGIDWRAEGLSFHSFRHFFNTRLVADGVNGELVRATVGHEFADMTKHYLHLLPSDMNRVLDVARKIENL